MSERSERIIRRSEPASSAIAERSEAVRERSEGNGRVSIAAGA
jgi:hypothetical protein